MMLGRDESMPNVVREPDMASEERERLRDQASSLLSLPNATSTMVAAAFVKSIPVDLRAWARAILRYVPAGVPDSAPHPVAAADDQTRRAMPAAGVICEPIAPDPSDGICEVSDDASTAAAKLDFTAAYDPSVHGEITRK